MKVKKNIKKISDFEHYVKKVEAQAKKWFSYKKTCNKMETRGPRTTSVCFFCRYGT